MSGIVYVLTNPAMQGYVKIGRTDNLTQRIRELDNTSAPLPFECAFAIEVDEPKKIEQLIANPKISISISNDGSNAKRQKSIQIIGKAEVSFDQGLMTKVHWAIIDKYWFDLKGNEEMRQAAFKGVHTPNRAIIKVIPNKTSPTSWDFGKMVQMYERGVWFNESYQMSKPYDIR